MKKSALKTTLISVGAVVAAIVLVAVSYVLYVVISYNRIEDNTDLQINANQASVLNVGQTYSIGTYNIGFGAYNQDFSFFMDSGTMLDGTKVVGKYAKARSKQIVLDNTNGSINAALQQQADFWLFQEVDVRANRSHKVNQVDMIVESFEGYAHTFATNFDSAYLMYPFNDPIGKSKSGLLTLSKFSTSLATRRSLPLSDGFAKFFDLDRCLMASRHPIEGGKELVVINAHLSAYDEGRSYS